MMSRKKPGLTKSGQPRCGKCVQKAKAQAFDYSAGVSFEEWGADADAPECQLCHRCDMMFLRSLVTECAQCFDSLCSACADGHADEHKPNDELAHREPRLVRRCPFCGSVSVLSFGPAEWRCESCTHEWNGSANTALTDDGNRCARCNASLHETEKIHGCIMCAANSQALSLA